MKRKQYFVCQKCKVLQEGPLTLHIFGDTHCTVLLDVCTTCHSNNMDTLELAAGKA